MTKRNLKVIYSNQCIKCGKLLQGRQRKWCSHICEVNNWQKNNYNKTLKWKRDWILRHPERRKEVIKKYDTSERGRKRRKEWEMKNADKLREQARINSKRYRDRLTSQRHKRRAIIKNLKEHFTKNEWRTLKKKWNYQCLRCKRIEPEILLTPDHITPISRGGKNTIENIQPLCEKCNKWKYTKIIDYRS